MEEFTKKPSWTVDEFAARWGISRGLVYKEIKSGDLPTTKIGRLTRITLEQEKEWIDKKNKKEKAQLNLPLKS